MAGRDELFVRLNENDMFNGNLERKVSDQHIVIKTMTKSVKQLKRKANLLQDEISRL